MIFRQSLIAISAALPKKIRLAIEARYPYSEWEWQTTCRDSSRPIFPTGGAGALYPPGIFDPRVIDDATFARLCPTADDIWLYWMVRLKGATSRCIGRRPVVTWPVRQTERLSSENLRPTGRNEICIEQ